MIAVSNVLLLPIVQVALFPMENAFCCKIQLLLAVTSHPTRGSTYPKLQDKEVRQHMSCQMVIVGTYMTVVSVHSY